MVKKDEEKNLTLKLTDKYQQLYKYLQARELFEKAINITKELGERKNEAYSNGRVGIISYYLGDYDKAKEYIEKALAITLQIGDKKGEASSYNNLGAVLNILVNMAKLKNIVKRTCHRNTNW